MPDTNLDPHTGEPSQETMDEDVHMPDAEEEDPSPQTNDEESAGGDALLEDNEGEEEDGEANERSTDAAWEDNDEQTSMDEADRAFAQARKAKPIKKGKKRAGASAPPQVERARERARKEVSTVSASSRGDKGKGSTKKSKKVNIKEEDLDSSNIVVATDDQAVLDAAFLGFVRVAIVDPDPTVTARYKVINDRDIDNKHRKTMVESFHVRKADWEHPAHVLVDGSKLDPTCLAQSPYPVKDLKTWQWNCPPQQRIVEFLSGNHRRVASEDFTKELSDELRAIEAKREVHREAQAKGGQKEITADGQLVDEVDVQLETKIAKLTAAVQQARMWTLKAYDKRRMEGKTAALALLATNELQPAKAATAQEKVQMMRWHVDQQLKKWGNDHPGQVLPAPGTPTFRKDILGVVMTGNDMKEGIANFLFVEPDNFTLIHDLWQLPYFGLTGKIVLSRLEKALGKVSKKDLSKKSSSSMLWRWVVHKLMRDLRLVGTTVEFPDVDDDQDEQGHHMENFVKVLEGSQKPLVITNTIWKDASYHTEKARKTSKAITKVQAFAYQNARKRYEKDEDELVDPTKLSVVVWDPAILAIVDDVYTQTFRPLAWTKFGDWKHKVWREAMRKYTARLNPLLEAAWTTRLEDVGDNDEDAGDAIAVREAEEKLKWLQRLQRLDGRALTAPLLCDKFMEDFTEVIMRAEGGFKLVTRTLDPLAQIGVLRAAASDLPGSGKEVFNDYLSYVTGILMNGDRFKFKTLSAARDSFCSWLLANMSLIKKCGDAYQSQYLTATHEAFLSISPNQLIGEASKLHKKSKDKEKEFIKADKFPDCLATAFPSIKFDASDCEAVMNIFRILLDTAPRLVPGSTAQRDAATITSAAQQDMLGRGLSVLSLADVDKFPCLAILYRHGQAWNNPEFGAKKGKSNGFLGYAYFLYMGWRVYGDTIGRMLALEEYTDLRDSLFSFLGTCCQPNLDDFLGEHTERPPTASFVNWDHKVLDRFVNLHGKLISEETQTSEAAGGAPGSKFAAPTVVLFDSSKMALHSASLKKGFDSLVKHPLARFNARKGTCSPRIAELARELAQEMIQNALEDEFHATNPESEAPYIQVAEADLEQFLPVLPTASEEPSRSTYRTLSSFSRLDPDQYRLYCHGLVAEGYAQAKHAEGSEGSSSNATAVRRTSSRRSGLVFPQDIDWAAEWADVDPKTLDAAVLPDPAGVATDKGGDQLRLHERYGVPPPGAPARRTTRAAQREANEAAKEAPVPSTSSEIPSPPRTTPSASYAQPSTAPAASSPLPTPATSETAAPETAALPPAPPPEKALPPPAAAFNLAAPPPAPHIPQGFTVRPRATGTSADAASSQTTDCQAEDPDADGEPDTVPPESHEPPTQVFVPSSSQTSQMHEDPVRARDTTEQPYRPSSSLSQSTPTSSPLPNMVPSTFPEEPSQLPPIPTPVVHATVVATLPPPTSDECGAFEDLTTGLNLPLITQLFFNVIEEVKADPKSPYRYGESPDVCVARIANFWARVRDRKQTLIPDQVFAYLRDDHPDVSSAATWSQFLDIYAIPHSGAIAIGRARARFRTRADPNYAPIFDNAPDAAAAVALATQASIAAAQSTAAPRDTADELQRKKRDRSKSLLEDTRKDGGASPPSNRAKRVPAEETPRELKPSSSAIFDRSDQEPRNLRTRPPQRTPGNPPQVLTPAARGRASSASSSKPRGGKSSKSANTAALPPVNEHSESGIPGQDRGESSAVPHGERVRQLVQGKQLVPRKP